MKKQIEDLDAYSKCKMAAERRPAAVRLFEGWCQAALAHWFSSEQVAHLCDNFFEVAEQSEVGVESTIQLNECHWMRCRFSDFGALAVEAGMDTTSIFIALMEAAAEVSQTAFTIDREKFLEAMGHAWDRRAEVNHAPSTETVQ